MILSDLGADVARVARPETAPASTESGTGESGTGESGTGESGTGESGTGESGTEKMIAGRRRIDPVTRGRRDVAADLKNPDGLAAVARLIDRADVLIEGYRPGVAERLGLGPDECLRRNPRLIYARMTGWGQDGPYAQVPGHDINYVALTGALDALRRGPGEPPAPPLNLLGDYGGGGMLLVVGILAALVERSVSGRGQVVDAAMTDGVALLTTLLHGMRAEGLWNAPGSNVLDLGAPFYNVYETADGRHVTIGCGEPKFYASLLSQLGLPDGERAELLRGQAAPETWPEGKKRLAAAFRAKTFAQWRELLEGTDTCFAPVLTLGEAPEHPHLRARGTFVTVDGVTQPAPAPRFSRTPPVAPPAAGGGMTGIDGLLRDWGA